MYSLIIVDDDELIRKGLEKVIPWHDMGIEVIGTFSSADDALSFLHESIADIILTDVKMPGMTGLELVEEAKKLNPACKAVIISGFSEFELVKNALILKVEDYLLKPLSQKDIERVFLKIANDLDDAKAVVPDAEMVFRNGYNIAASLSGEYSLWNEYHPQSVNKLVLVCADALDMIDPCLASVPHVIKGHYAVFIAGDDKYSMLIEEIRKMLKSQPFRIVIGSDVFWTDDIIASFWSAFGILAETQPGEISSYRDKRGDDPLNLVKFERKVLIDAIESGNQEEIDNAVIDATARTKMLRDIDQGYVYCSIIYKLLVYFSFQDSINEFRYGSVSFSNASEEELASRFEDDFRHLLSLLSARSDSSSRLLMTRTQQYVMDHFGNPALRLQEIADELNVSYGYLSSIFARISGQSFKQFLIQVRMEEARKLLLSRKYRIYEIADKVGYSNPRYFNEAFRKYYSCSPAEYLSNLR